MWKIYVPLIKPGLTTSIVFSAVATAFAAAGGHLPPGTLSALIAVAFLASSGSCALNHYLDRNMDGVMARTRNRPLPSGHIVHQRRVLWAGLLLISVSLLLSQYFFNTMTTFYLFLGSFVYVAVYTLWLKKRSSFNIVIGGLAGSFAAMAGGASVTPEAGLPPILVGLIIFLWTPSHFWSFAIAKHEDYRKAGIPMLPVLIGDKRAARYILLNTVFLFLTSLLPYALGIFGEVYLLAALATGAYFMSRSFQLLSHATSPVAIKNFKASMLYLFVLLLAVIVDSILTASAPTL